MDGTRVFAQSVAVLATLVIAAVPASAASAVSASPTGSASVAASTVTGTVQDIIVDNPRRHTRKGDVRRVLRVGDDVISLTDGSLPAVPSGNTVRAAIAPAGDGRSRVLSATTVAHQPQPSAGTTSGPAASGATGGDAAREPAAAVHDVHAVIVRPVGVAADSRLTTSAVTTAVSKAASYWSSQTGGNVVFQLAQVAPSYQSSFSCQDGGDGGFAEDLIWDEALSRIDIPDAANQHLMIFVPPAAVEAGCSYGLGSIGFWAGKPGLTFVADTNQSLVAHELGHNLTLMHSNSLRCLTIQDAAYVADAGGWPESCYGAEYDDLLDVMGYSGVNFGEGSLNAVHLDQMGLLPTAVRTISTAGTYTVRLAPLSAAPTALRAVKIVSAGQSYYVEYRTNSGRDTVATRNPLRPSLGVRVLRQDPRFDESGSYVLDATPSSAWEYASSLAVGRTFTAASRLLTVTVTTADSTGATLLIRTGTLSAPVRVALSGLPTAARTGTVITPRVQVTNAAGRPVSNWTVRLQRLASGGTSYVTVKTARTNVNGLVSFRITHSRSARYRCVTSSTSRVASVSSKAGYVAVRLW